MSEASTPTNLLTPDDADKCYELYFEQAEKNTKAVKTVMQEDLNQSYERLSEHWKQLQTHYANSYSNKRTSSSVTSLRAAIKSSAYTAAEFQAKQRLFEQTSNTVLQAENHKLAYIKNVSEGLKLYQEAQVQASTSSFSWMLFIVVIGGAIYFINLFIQNR